MSNGSGLFSNQHPIQDRFSRPGMSGVTGELGDLRAEIGVALSPLIAVTVDEIIHPALAAAANLEALHASVVGSRTVTTFLAAGTAALAACPRNITFTVDGGGTPGHSFTQAIITGKDVAGKPLSETLTLVAGAGLNTGASCFASVSSIVYSGGTGVLASISIGIGLKLGLSKSLKARSGRVQMRKEIFNGRDITGGIRKQQIVAPLADDDLIVLAVAVPAVGLSLTIAAQPDVPRNVSLITTADGGLGAWGAAPVTVTGTDIWDRVLAETISVAGISGTYTGLDMFKTITSIVVPAQAAPPWAGTGTIKVGTGVQLALDTTANAGKPMQEMANGAVPAGAGAIALGPSGTPYGGYTPVIAPAGTTYNLWYSHRLMGTVQSITVAPPYGAYIPVDTGYTWDVFTLEYEYDPLL